jgi:hypothetical protein
MKGVPMADSHNAEDVYAHLPEVSGDEHHPTYWDHDSWGNVFPGEGSRYNSGEIVWRTATAPTMEGQPIGPKDVAEVTHIWALSYQEYADQSMVAVMRLKDGRWACVETWSDSSGYGCQDGTDWYIGDTFDAVVRWGLTDEGRTSLGLSVDGEHNGRPNSPERNE